MDWPSNSFVTSSTAASSAASSSAAGAAAGLQLIPTRTIDTKKTTTSIPTKNFLILSLLKIIIFVLTALNFVLFDLGIKIITKPVRLRELFPHLRSNTFCDSKN
ncbi:hypothetical protein ES708_10609 [subsurface metagenome]